MSFAAGITRAPVPFDRDRARETLARLPRSDAGDLLAGAAGCSPYLAGLMVHEASWLESALPAAPEDTLKALLALPQTGDQAALRIDLRQAKRRVALLVALADLGGLWDLDVVTGALTRFADHAADLALRAALAPEFARDRLPGRDPATAGGLCLLAMGKMGAFELNYSSDIDLIALFDDAGLSAADLAEIRAVHVRAVRRAMAILSDHTGDGYVFRTDLRLRPDPSVTAVAVSVSGAERYYEALGRTWERAAFIKARPAAGDTATGARFLSAIGPFIWRRHLDYATVEDAHEIRRKIRVQVGPTATALDGRDVKLGQGGIREIEFFTQTQQLIAGGRDPSLRLRGTRAGLAQLAARGWVHADTAAALDAAYRRLREVEHRLQMVGDQQTHDLPAGAEGWKRLACFLGDDDAGALRAELAGLFDAVHAKTEGFFVAGRGEGSGDATAAELMRRWERFPALRSDRARRILARLMPDLLARFERAARPDEAIAQFEAFLGAQPAGVQLFSLFEANRHLIDLMVDITASAPALARHLASHAQVLDAVIGGEFFSPWPGAARMTEDLRSRLSDPALDHERRLDAARRWMRDWHFRIGVHHLRGLTPVAELTAQYSDLAEACVVAMWELVCGEFAERHGPLPGRGAVVAGMGSLGAGQLTARSDLDLIVIYDAGDAAMSEGPRPLAARAYYARLTRALVTALSAKTAAGALYEVDMRLRPSGRQGPAATSWASYRDYQRHEAWTWEHMALTRLRPLAGAADLAADLEAFRVAFIAEGRAAAPVMADLADMRRRLAEAKARRSVWDVAAGPGGLQDIELFAQARALLAGAPARAVAEQLAAATPGEEAALRRTHGLLLAVKAAERLLTGEAMEPETLGAGGVAMLLREAGRSALAELSQDLRAATDAAATLIDAGIAGALAAQKPVAHRGAKP